MNVELKVPAVGESITEVEIGGWLKQEGERVAKDENVAVIETEKATVDLSAPVSGTITKIVKAKGARATVGEVVGYMVAGDPPAPTAKTKPTKTAPAKTEPRVMPAAARVMAEKGITVDAVTPTGPGGRVLKEDVERTAAAKPVAGGLQEEVVPMSLLRRKIAARLVQAQQTAALLTTFNEVDVSAVMALRKQYQEKFMERYNIKLGLMSFFVKATVEALKEIPVLNAEVRGETIVYRNYYDIGVAVGGGKGLVVPILRGADRLSFAEIELAIAAFAQRVKDNRIRPEDLHGGTFTITNGGVFGSLLSTPIINPPQSGILGMHTIQDRPVALDGQVVIRPMMYLALTYDHRIVDGREAVTFVKRIKEVIEKPARMLIEV